MDNPSSQPAADSDTLDDSRSMSEANSTDSTDTWGWGSEVSTEDSDECEVDSLADEGCADETYWVEDTAADAWLARFPGGTSLLYPQLFVVKPYGGKVLTPSRYPNTNSLLHLPPEIRNRIYRHYFDSVEEAKHPEEMHAPFRDREGTEMQRICLGSENVELKFWLSTALLQTSRQLRSEAMVIFFINRVITVEWLPVLPRLVEFLGKEGCAMVRYLDIWDTLNLQGADYAGYRKILTSVMHFSCLQHLRIVISWGFGLLDDRRCLWFDQNEWKPNGTLMKRAVPKLRSEDIEMHWPEYEVLKNLKARNFTLGLEPHRVSRYLEFDRTHGAYPEISRSMKSHATRTQPAPSSANLATSSNSPQVLEAFEPYEIQSFSNAVTPNTGFDDEDSDSPTWQETETLNNKTIPLYNFIREFFHKNRYNLLGPVRGGMSVDNFVCFPTARKSRGSIMQDCAFCYLSGRHCGYHAVPDQPPFQRNLQEGDDEEEDVKTLQRRFDDLSYVDMREVCRDVVRCMEGTDNPVIPSLSWDSDRETFLKIAAVFDYLGWPEALNSERLNRLDAAVDAGWMGKRVDKDEVPPWDVLYREVHAQFSFLYSIRGEARSS